VNRRERKEKYVAKLQHLINEYKNVLVVKVDNVGSNQIQKIRGALRGIAVVLMGKNTIIRKVLRENVAANPKLETLIPLLYGNVGFIFTNANLNQTRKIIQENKVPAPARVGTMAPNDVIVPAGSTGMDPGQTSFFQALNIATKIVKGAIEIINEVLLIRKGEKVTASHVALLDKLNIRPFSYGMIVTDVYEDGTVYAASVLDMSQEDLYAKFFASVRKLAAVSLAISYPTLAALPYFIGNAFAKLVALSVETDYTFDKAQKFKDFIANPTAFAAAAPAAAAAAAAGGDAKGGKKEEPKKEEPKEEEEDEGIGGFSLFGDD